MTRHLERQLALEAKFAAFKLEAETKVGYRCLCIQMGVCLQRGLGLLIRQTYPMLYNQRTRSF